MTHHRREDLVSLIPEELIVDFMRYFSNVKIMEHYFSGGHYTHCPELLDDLLRLGAKVQATQIAGSWMNSREQLPLLLKYTSSSALNRKFEQDWCVPSDSPQARSILCHATWELVESVKLVINTGKLTLETISEALNHYKAESLSNFTAPKLHGHWFSFTDKSLPREQADEVIRLLNAAKVKVEAASGIVVNIKDEKEPSQADITALDDNEVKSCVIGKLSSTCTLPLETLRMSAATKIVDDYCRRFNALQEANTMAIAV